MPYRLPKVLEVATHGAAQLSSSSARTRYDAGVATVLNTTDFLLAYFLDPPTAGSGDAIEVIKGKALGGASTLGDFAVVDTGDPSVPAEANIEPQIFLTLRILKLDSTRAMVFWNKQSPVGGFQSGPSNYIWAAVVTYTDSGPPTVGTPTQVTFVGSPATRWYYHSNISPVLRPDGSVVFIYVDENVTELMSDYVNNLRAVHLAVSGSTITPTPSSGEGYLIDSHTAVVRDSGGRTLLANLPNGEMLSRWSYPGPAAPDPTHWNFLQQTGSVVAQVGPTTALEEFATLDPTGNYVFAIVSDSRLREMGNGGFGVVIRERTYNPTNHTVQTPSVFEEHPADTGWNFGAPGDFVQHSLTANDDILWLGIHFSEQLGNEVYGVNILRQKKVPYGPLDTGQLSDPYVLPPFTDDTNTAEVFFARGAQSAVAGTDLIVLAYDLDVRVRSGSPNQSLDTVKVMVVHFTPPPLRWRQRDDCLTPGTATPCMCNPLNSGLTLCIPAFWIRFQTSVQWGGRVGPRNRAL